MRNTCLYLMVISILSTVLFTVNAQVPATNVKARLLTEEEGCGIPKLQSTLNFRIVGGTRATRGAFPWMVLLGYVNGWGEQDWRCGGSLITSRHVLTAAHCATRNLVVARLGEHNINSDNDGIVQDIAIVRPEINPNYNRRDGTNDIAILHLAYDAQFSNRVRPICLPINEPVRSRSFIGANPFIAGWGLQEGGRRSRVLQQVQLPILENSECENRYRRAGRWISDQQFGSSIICAGDLKGGRDSCKGDSGGPMMHYFGSGTKYRFYQIGVVSYGIGCARVDTPGVYTRVPEFVDWIQYVVNQSY